MKKMGLSLTVLTLALTLGACGKKEDTPVKNEAVNEVLKVGTDATFNPFEFKGKDGKYTGFDVELIQSLAKEMGYKDVDFVETEFKSFFQ
ncbi:amino acid ABC transporter substrate-binding protein [Fictibacillus macauensis ZFHKF-1]|uniref:Amino acid ABC transporter substrate-binding protein n=1 Tax=Fictibacillus macauensis ZFHKF-1 TaxID=1196324 RepID=I8ALD2_9BACL|nr:transporter substrate-binding domain-containing protein [Fictibacillus macauensis]EIT86702.1 amino acid ABC transporter substrate-binding protein [Fictibacillus macauensis ZFHKF-1]